MSPFNHAETRPDRLSCTSSDIGAMCQVALEKALPLLASAQLKTG
jgi:hypothetical protein